jgi:hypothetical protein
LDFTTDETAEHQLPAGSIRNPNSKIQNQYRSNTPNFKTSEAIMQFKKLEFENKEGQTLSARLDLPVDGKPLAYALFAHCFTCSKNIKAIAHISRALTRAGLAVLRFDFTGLGESEGDFADTNFSSNVDDLIVAIFSNLITKRPKY